MRRLSWIVLPTAMLALLVVSLTTNAGIPSENEEETRAEEREWGKEVQGLRMSIQPRDYDEKEYGPVTLSVIVKNVGKEEVTYMKPSMFIDYGLTIRDSRGEEVPLTLNGKRFFNRKYERRRVPVRLKPGEQKEYTLVASRYYDMTLPGTYTITSTLADYPLRSTGTLSLTSNTITVKVPE